jgi:uncharacterized membrane protein
MASLKRRFVVKALTYRTMTLISGIIIIGLVTGSWALASGIAVVVAIVNTILYAIHEYFWNKTEWGRDYESL